MPFQGHWARTRKLLDILIEKELNTTKCGEIIRENIQHSLTCLKKNYAGGGVYFLNMRLHMVISVTAS